MVLHSILHNTVCKICKLTKVAWVDDSFYTMYTHINILVINDNRWTKYGELVLILPS